MNHALGCVRLRGANATTKHNSIVAFLSGLCREAGLPHEVEPRGFQSYKCASCGRSFAQLEDHPATCRGQPHRSGPDLRIDWPSGPVWYDYATVHEMAPSNANKALLTLAKSVVDAKVRRYCGAGGVLTPETFMPLPAYSFGALHANTRGLLAELAACSGRSRDSVFRAFASRLQREQALTLLRLFRPTPRPHEAQADFDDGGAEEAVLD
jgi:hypothetical protein